MLIVFMAGSLSCGEIPENQKFNEFFWDPVKAHIEKYGAGIDMSYRPEHKDKNKQLRKKNFK